MAAALFHVQQFLADHVFPRKVRATDERILWERGLDPKTKISRTVEFDVNAKSIGATQTINVQGDMDLCKAIHESSLRGKEPGSSHPLRWVVGDIHVDGFSVPINDVDLTVDDESKQCTVSATTERGDLFRGEDD